MKEKKCKQCKKDFKPARPLQYLCGFTCANRYLKDRKKDKKKEQKTVKDSLITYSEWLKIFQATFNLFIRLRDKQEGCISCGNNDRQMHAGHYRSVGSAPHLRFNELNVHKQCAKCNNYLHGNLIDYRINLIKKIGIEEVESIESNNTSFKLSIPEVKELIIDYKQKIKDLKDGKAANRNDKK